MKKTYQITFKAELTEDDIKAMNKCFFDAMNEAMDIHELWDLELTEIKEQDTKPTQTTEYRHIRDCENALMNSKNINEVRNLLEDFPRWSGEWWIDTVLNTDGSSYYEVTNQYYNEQCSELCANTYDLEIEVEEE